MAFSMISSSHIFTISQHLFILKSMCLIAEEVGQMPEQNAVNSASRRKRIDVECRIMCRYSNKCFGKPLKPLKKRPFFYGHRRDWMIVWLEERSLVPPPLHHKIASVSIISHIITILLLVNSPVAKSYSSCNRVHLICVPRTNTYFNSP